MARCFGSDGYKVLLGAREFAKYADIARDSQITKPSSSSVGTQCCGFMATNHGWSCSFSNKLTLMTWKNGEKEESAVDYSAI